MDNSQQNAVHLFRLAREIGRLKGQAEDAWLVTFPAREDLVAYSPNLAGLHVRRAMKLADRLQGGAQASAVLKDLWEEFKRGWRDAERDETASVLENQPDEEGSHYWRGQELLKRCPTRVTRWWDPVARLPSEIAARRGQHLHLIVELAGSLLLQGDDLPDRASLDYLQEIDAHLEMVRTKLGECAAHFPQLGGVPVPDAEEAFRCEFQQSLTAIADDTERRLSSVADQQGPLGLKFEAASRSVRRGSAKVGPLSPLLWALFMKLFENDRRFCGREILEPVWLTLNLAERDPGSGAAASGGKGGRLALAMFELRKELAPLRVTAQGYRDRGWRLEELGAPDEAAVRRATRKKQARPGAEQ